MVLCRLGAAILVLGAEEAKVSTLRGDSVSCAPTAQKNKDLILRKRENLELLILTRPVLEGAIPLSTDSAQRLTA